MCHLLNVDKIVTTGNILVINNCYICQAKLKPNVICKKFIDNRFLTDEKTIKLYKIHYTILIIDSRTDTLFHSWTRIPITKKKLREKSFLNTYRCFFILSCKILVLWSTYVSFQNLNSSFNKISGHGVAISKPFKSTYLW